MNEEILIALMLSTCIHHKHENSQIQKLTHKVNVEHWTLCWGNLNITAIGEISKPEESIKKTKTSKNKLIPYDILDTLNKNENKKFFLMGVLDQLMAMHKETSKNRLHCTRTLAMQYIPWQLTKIIWSYTHRTLLRA